MQYRQMGCAIGHTDVASTTVDETIAVLRDVQARRRIHVSAHQGYPLEGCPLCAAMTEREARLAEFRRFSAHVCEIS